ncbi:MAG: hypothetical protein AB1896_20595, partial [Thermodesulfobacteriota bacterium]
PTAPAGEAQEAEEKHKIKDAAGNEIARVKNMGGGRWTVTVDNRKFALESEGPDVYSFELPGGEKLKAKKKENKLKLKRGEEVLVEVKFYEDKFKVTPAGSDTYQFKYKEEKVKVYLGDRELGQVKYYPDTGKLKAKDEGGREVAVTRGATGVSAGLAPFLMEKTVPPETRYFLVAVLYALNK